jgi:polyhydroxyalkanoate synthesis repressor PhaR
MPSTPSSIPTEPIRIRRYPNRRFYATHTSRYISLPEIEKLVHDGATVEIVDSQTGEDLTRAVLVQIIAERHPEKIAMFPSAMLHSILRANDFVSDYWREYFRNSLAYLNHLQKQGASSSFQQPMQWMKPWLDTWFDSIYANRAPETKAEQHAAESADVTDRITTLEKRIAELEAERKEGK